MQVAGIVKYVFDNRLAKDGSPNKFPNYKFKIGENEIVLWSAIKPVFLEKGKNLSVICQASKKNGSLFVQSKEDKSPMIQELPNDAKLESKPDTTFNVDDFESQNFNEAVTSIEKDMASSPVVKKSFNKDEVIFVMSLLKSGIESNQITCNKEDIDTKIKEYKFLFQVNFNN